MRLSAIGLLVILVVSAAEGDAAPNAAELRSAILQHGAKAVVDGLVAQDRWNAVSDRVASGDVAWIALVPLLARGTDAGTSEDLGVDLAFALPKQPDAVLRVADERPFEKGGIIGIERVCGRPFIEDTEPRNYVRRATQALRQVVAPALADKKQHCLAELTRQNP